MVLTSHGAVLNRHSHWRRREVLGAIGAFLAPAVVRSETVPTIPASSVPAVRLILCVLGPADWLPTAARCIRDYGRGFHFDEDYSAEGFDDRMPASFEVSWNRVPNTFDDSDLAAVWEHRSLVYALSEDLRPETSLRAAADAIGLIDRLITAGALACKCETGGVAHGMRHWRRYAARLAEADPVARTEILYRAFVRRPLDDEGVIYTAGMHALGLPDIDYRGGRNLLAATACIDRVGKAVVAGEPPDLPRVPCSRYAVDEFLYNPYGVLLIEDGDIAGPCHPAA